MKVGVPQPHHLERQFGEAEWIERTEIVLARPFQEGVPQPVGEEPSSRGSIDHESAGLPAIEQPVAQALVEERNTRRAVLEQAWKAFVDQSFVTDRPAEELPEPWLRHGMLGCGKDFEQRHVALIVSPIGKMPPEPALVETDKALRKVLRRFEWKRSLRDRLPQHAQIEKVTLGRGENAFKQRFSLVARQVLSRQPSTDINARIFEILRRFRFYVHGNKAGELAKDGLFRPASHDQGNPAGELCRMGRQNLDQFATPIAHRLVEAIDHDRETVLAPASVDGGRQWLDQQPGKERGRASALYLLAVFPPQPVDQKPAVIGQPGRHLEGERTQHAAGVAADIVVVETEIDAEDMDPAVVGQPGGKSALARASAAAQPKQARVTGRVLPVGELLLQPLTANEAVDQLDDVGALRRRREAALQLLDLGGEALRLRAGEQVEQLLQLGPVPALKRLWSGRLVPGPVVHVEPVDVAHQGGRRLHHLGVEQNGGDRAAFLVQSQAELIEADTGIAHGMAGEEAQGPVRVLQAVDDATAPVLAGLDRRPVAPDVVAGGDQVALDAIDDRLVVGLVAVAQEDLHRAASPPTPDLATPWRRSIHSRGRRLVRSHSPSAGNTCVRR